MKTLLLIIQFLVTISVFSQFQEWERSYNGSGNSNDEASFITADQQGNVIVCGRIISTGSNNNFCTIKYSTAGSLLWTAIYNGPGNNYDEPTGIVTDAAGNVYVTGNSLNGSNYDIISIKYNSAGVQEWAQVWGGAGSFDDGSGGIYADNSGNVYVTGNTKVTSSNTNYITLKYNSAGTLQWAKQYNNPSNGSDMALFIAGTGDNVYVTGTSSDAVSGPDFLTIKYNSNGDSLWTARYGNINNINEIPYGFAVDANGNAYVTGMTQGAGSGIDYMTIKYNTNGAEQWHTRYTSPGNTQDIPEGLTVDGNGNVYVTGRVRPNGSYNDFGTVKYNSAGVQQWAAIYDNSPESRDDYGYDIAVDNSGNVYVTGNSQESGTNRDVLTIKYNSSGTEQWVARYDSASSEEAYSIALDGNNNVYVAGYQSLGNSNFLTIKYSGVNGITPISNEIPEAYELSQNYPNPFNPSTNINFSIPKWGFVNITVFDITGKETAVLVNENLNAGKYKADFDASLLSSGAYFYRISTGDFAQTKKMLIVK